MAAARGTMIVFQNARSSGFVGTGGGAGAGRSLLARPANVLKYCSMGAESRNCFMDSSDYES
jgi:hypothetical protein